MVHAAGLTVFMQTAAEVLHGLLVVLEAELAERDFAFVAALSIHEAQVAEGGGREFLGRENLDEIHVEAARDERGEARFITGGIEKIAEHDGDASLAGVESATSHGGGQIRRAAGAEFTEVAER